MGLVGEAFWSVAELEWPLLLSKALHASHWLRYESDTHYESHIASIVLLQSYSTEGKNIGVLSYCGDVDKEVSTRDMRANIVGFQASLLPNVCHGRSRRSRPGPRGPPQYSCLQ